MKNMFQLAGIAWLVMFRRLEPALNIAQGFCKPRPSIQGVAAPIGIEPTLNPVQFKGLNGRRRAWTDLSTGGFQNMAGVPTHKIRSTPLPELVI
jgi:hypothetical protein